MLFIRTGCGANEDGLDNSMKRSTKAALISALVYPGAGHIMLKKPVTGFALIAAASAALWVVFSITISHTTRIVDKITSSELQPDIKSMMDMVTASQTPAEAHRVKIATVIFAIVWLAAAIDAYRMGRRQDPDSQTGG